jgi:hypothetical protein
MTEFVDQDLSGTRFERVSLRNALMRRVDLSGAEIRGGLLHDVRMIGLEMRHVEISGALDDVIVNGVDIAPLVDQELNRRMPERAKMRPDDVEGFQEAWSILERLWEATLEHARSLPAEALHTRVDGEWSFIETLRHLNFASAAWVGRMILGDPSPWHPLDLPWDEAPGWEGVPWDREACPPLEVVLAVRRDRQAMVRTVIASLTDEKLASQVSNTEPGWPRADAFPFKECLLIVLDEEWQHRRYAERDLAKLDASASG